MAIVRSLPTMLLLTAAVLLTLLGGRGRGGDVLSFFGGLLWCAGLVCALVAGAGLEELLVCVLAAAVLSQVRREGRGGG